MPHPGHYKPALTPSAFGFSSSLTASFFSAFSGACKTQIAHVGASDSIQINSSANCGGLLPHMTHTTHAKHQNQNLYFRERERELLSEKSETLIKPPATHSQKRKEPFWSLPTCFDPLCLWLFFHLSWLLFLGLFWGLEDTDCTSRCTRFYSNQ